MNPQLYPSFAKYNQVMNHKLFAGAAKLSEVDRMADKGAFFKSVYSNLEHIMLADLIWLRRFKTIPQLHDVLKTVDDYPQVKQFGDDLFDNFEDLSQSRKKLDVLIVKFTLALSDEILEKSFQYKNMAGKEFENTLWICVSHFFNHQTHHRGQATTLLSQFGVDVGVTDFPAVIKE